MEEGASATAIGSQGGMAMAQAHRYVSLCFTVFLLLYSWLARSHKTRCRNNGNGTNENESGDGVGDGDAGLIGA